MHLCRTRTFICIRPSIGDKDVYWTVPFALQVHPTTARSKIKGFFDAIERWGDIFGPGYVDENLDTLRERHGSLCSFMNGWHIECSRLQ